MIGQMDYKVLEESVKQVLAEIDIPEQHYQHILKVLFAY